MPIYEDIARDLLEAIHRGQYPVGGLIPTELELAARYEVSRQTVRAAMRRLTELGAVSRRKGSGTRVETRERPQESFQQTLGSLSDLVALAAATDRDIRSIETVVMDRKAARRFGCQPGSRWLRIAYVRASTKPKSPPLAWVDCYVEESYADAVSDIRKDRRLVCDMIADSYGVIGLRSASNGCGDRDSERVCQGAGGRSRIVRARSDPPLSGLARPPVRDIGKHPSRRPIRRDVGAEARR